MRHQILAALAVFPLLLSPSNAAQRWTVESSQPFGIPSEDSGTSAYLGVDIMDVTQDRLGALKLKEEKGVEVTMVDQDAPAGKAGIKEHDVILTLNGAAVESKTQLHRIIHETPPGRVIALGLSRDGQALTIKIQLADRGKEFAHMGKNDFHFEVPPIPSVPPIPNLPDFDMPSVGVVVVHSSMRSGLMVENITPQLGEFFGVKNGNGVLVRSVEKGSRADKAGLHAGDVITRVGDQSVHDTSDFTHFLHSHAAGSVTVGVIRDKKETTLTITLPERKDSGEMIDESFEMPDLDAETAIELSNVRDEIAKLQPQMQLARDEAMKAAKEVSRAFCDEQKKAMEKIKQEMEPGIREQLEKSRQKLQQDMERLKHQMQGDWVEI
jgi:predicted metalloprotease with PDZ domain